MHNNPSNSKAQSEKTIDRDMWWKTLRRISPIVAKASGTACRVFTALQSYADADGYCWPLIVTLQNFTGIKRRDTIFGALRELETLDIVFRRQLISRRGRNSPTLYRIGRKVEKLPDNAAARYVLGPRRLKKSSIPEHLEKGRGPEKRNFALRARRRTEKRDPGSIPPSNRARKKRVIAQKAVPERPNLCEVPKNGTGGVPKNGTQNLSTELVHGLPSVLEREKVSGVALTRSQNGKQTPKTYVSQNQNQKQKMVRVDSWGTRLADQGADDE
jgi:hypothetical protein